MDILFMLPGVLLNIVDGYLYWKQKLLDVADSQYIKEQCWPSAHSILKRVLSLERAVGTRKID